MTVQQQEGGEVGEGGRGGVGQQHMKRKLKEGGKGEERGIQEEVERGCGINLEVLERKLEKHVRDMIEAKRMFVQEREGVQEQYQDRKGGEKGEAKEIWWSDGMAEREKKNKEQRGRGMGGGRTEWCRMEGGVGNGRS